MPLNDKDVNLFALIVGICALGAIFAILSFIGVVLAKLLLMLF